MAKIGEVCPVSIYSGDEFVAQLNSTTFLVYGDEPIRAYVNCFDEEGSRTYENTYKMKGANYLSIYKNCDINLQNHFLSSSLPFTADILAKTRSINLHLKELIDLGEEEMDEFIAFVKKDLKPEDRPIHLVSAKQKFDLKKITSHGNFTSEIFTYITAVVGLIIALIIIGAIWMAWKKHDQNKKRDGYPEVRINFQSLLASRGEDIAGQAVSDENETDGKDRKLTVTEQKLSENFVQLKV